MAPINPPRTCQPSPAAGSRLSPSQPSTRGKTRSAAAGGQRCQVRSAAVVSTDATYGVASYPRTSCGLSGIHMQARRAAQHRGAAAGACAPPAGPAAVQRVSPQPAADRAADIARCPPGTATRRITCSASCMTLGRVDRAADVRPGPEVGAKRRHPQRRESDGEQGRREVAGAHPVRCSALAVDQPVDPGADAPRTPRTAGFAPSRRARRMARRPLRGHETPLFAGSVRHRPQTLHALYQGFGQPTFTLLALQQGCCSARAKKRPCFSGALSTPSRHDRADQLQSIRCR